MKKLSFGFHFAVGRNRGRISSYHRGGGSKIKYKLVDFFRNLYAVQAKVIAFHHDPVRSARLALLAYTNGVLSYSIAVAGVNLGDYLSNFSDSQTFEHKSRGVSCPIRFVKPGTRINCVEQIPTRGAQFARSSGSFCTLVRKYDKLALLKLMSGEFRFFSLDCTCVIGSVESLPKGKYFGKAGLSRFYGWRPVVRGRAMNPVDHPHGGRTNGGMVPTTPWGLLAKGRRTSRSTSSLILKKLKT